MLPAPLSEDILSLKSDQDRLALSFLFYMDSSGTIHERKIVPSIVRISAQFNYSEVNDLVGQDAGRDIKILYELALRLRNERLEKGAVILPLPELQVYVNPAGMIQISRYEKETPSQILVSEWMIAANAFAGAYLAEIGVPSIYRNQNECREETELVRSEHELFRVYRQRRLFARAELDTEPRTHCSLAVPFYTTVTSPIRRYSDLVVQRQLKHALATGTALYNSQDLKQLITRLAAVQAKVFLVQRKWTRFWILKYMEQEDLQTLPALVLEQNPRFAHLLLPDFFLETNAPIPENSRFGPGEMVRVRIDKLSPRDDVLKVQVLDTPGR
jgi:exoribonuclease-2